MYRKAQELAKSLNWQMEDINSEVDYCGFNVVAVARLKDGSLIDSSNTTHYKNDIGDCAERKVIAKVIDAGIETNDIVEFGLWASDRGYEEINLSCCDECREAILKYCPESTIEFRFKNEIKKIKVSDLDIYKNFFLYIYDGLDRLPGYKQYSTHPSYLRFQKLSKAEQEIEKEIGIEKYNKEVQAIINSKNMNPTPTI